MSEVSIKAVVQKVITDGKHGPYAVASAEGLVGSITFSLEPTVWIEEDLPEEGTIVYLTNLRQKRAGWRAKKGQYFKRREVKPGKKTPTDFIEEQFDENTGKRVGWVPVDPSSKEDCWHMEAFSRSLSDGTYELVGPKVQGNPEGYGCHALVKHGEAQVFENAPRTFDGIADFMKDKNIEGIVFHHPDGRMGSASCCSC